MAQYAFTPQGSPPPSDGTWSQYGNAPSYPGSPGQPAYGTPMAHSSPHSRNPSDQSYYNPSLQSSPVARAQSPTAAAQEMPIVRSPAGFNAEPQMQSLNISELDPYFARNPPKGAGNEAT